MTQFVRFLLVGGVATLVQYVVLLAFVVGGFTGPVVGSTVGYIASAWLNYFANHRFTFRSARPHSVALPRFAVVVVFGVALNAMLMSVGTQALGLHYLFAQLLATAAVISWNFFAARRWSFGAAAN